MRGIALSLSLIFCIGNGEKTRDDKMDRRGFFTKIRDAYREGRLSANEKRIATRKEQEKLRRRMLFERNVKSLVDGLSKRLRHRRSTVSIVVIGATVLVVWLCHKGSIGCERDKATPNQTIQLGIRIHD